VVEATAEAARSIRGGSAGEPLWYALLRGREMLHEDGPLAAGPFRWPSLLDAAEDISLRFAGSPRLAAVCARCDGSVASARTALSVGPRYGPAQVALGRALLREGRCEAARALLEEVRDPGRVQGGAVALARARLETGDASKALAAAARETNPPGLSAVEPSIQDPEVARELDEVRGLARLALGATDAGVRPLLRAASAGASAARRALVANAGRPEVRRALARLAHDVELPPDARALAGVLSD
jgi:hypothetical protein